MKKNVILLLCTLFLLCSCGTAKDNPPTTSELTNIDVIKAVGFEIAADSVDLETAAIGTVFVKGHDANPDSLQIVAQIKIDDEDWGGINIMHSKEWEVAGFTYDFRANDEFKKEAGDIGYTYIDDSNYELPGWITLGYGYTTTPKGGGEGTIIIDLKLRDSYTAPEFTKLSICVGSRINKNGVSIINTDSLTIEFPLVKNGEAIFTYKDSSNADNLEQPTVTPYK